MKSPMVPAVFIVGLMIAGAAVSVGVMCVSDTIVGIPPYERGLLLIASGWTGFAIGGFTGILWAALTPSVPPRIVAAFAGVAGFVLFVVPAWIDIRPELGFLMLANIPAYLVTPREFFFYRHAQDFLSVIDVGLKYMVFIFFASCFQTVVYSMTAYGLTPAIRKIFRSHNKRGQPWTSAEGMTYPPE
jgi:hypothetical protein